MRRANFKRLWLIIFCFLFFTSKSAYADVGLPMIFISWPSMFLALIPVVVIEAMVFIKILRIDIKKALSVSFWANLTSTILGIPLSWLILLAIELAGAFIGVGVFKMQSWPPNEGLLSVPLMAAWLGPITKEYTWMIPAATACGLIPAYFLSIWIEFWVAKKKLKDLLDTKILYKAIQLANLASYTILMGLCVVIFLYLRFQVK